MKNAQLRGCIRPPLQLVDSDTRLIAIRQFRHQQYKAPYPTIDNIEIDPFDNSAIILYSNDDEGIINSTGRIVIDSECGLPEDDIFGPATAAARKRYRTAEFGRFATNSSSSGLMQSYYGTIYNIAEFLGLSIIFMVMREKDFAFHHRLMRAEKLPCAPIKNGFGSKHTFISVAWQINKTTDRFFHWCGVTKVPTFNSETSK